MNKVPLEGDFRIYDGAHTASLWKEVGEDWKCPSCERTKFEQLRWANFRSGLAKGFRPDPPQGRWIAILHRHHDHGTFYDDGHDHVIFSRFPATVICDLCNFADASAKTRIGITNPYSPLHRFFSFAPAEIGRFVVAVPHGRHRIDDQKAREVFQEVALFVRQIAEACAEKEERDRRRREERERRIPELMAEAKFVPRKIPQPSWSLPW